MRPVLRELALHNGVARSRTLFDAGVSRRTIEHALAQRSIIRPRKGWIASADADPDLVAAARRAVVLSCITQAKRLGFWVLAEPLKHVAARTPSSRSTAPHCVVHWGRPLQQRPPDALEDPLPNVLQFVADCQPWEIALSVWESALNKRAVDMETLRGLAFRGAARRLLGYCTPYSDSGLESMVKNRLRWLKLRITPQVWIHGHRVDFLIGERLVLDALARGLHLAK